MNLDITHLSLGSGTAFCSVLISDILVETVEASGLSQRAVELLTVDVREN
jgi:hypothetical protein